LDLPTDDGLLVEVSSASTGPGAGSGMAIGLLMEHLGVMKGMLRDPRPPNGTTGQQQRLARWGVGKTRAAPLAIEIGGQMKPK
jgi:hypothetical protein